MFAHSDCGGKIHPEQAGPLADSLEEIIPKLPEGDGGGHIRNWREKTQTFVDGLREVVETNEPMVFA